VAVPVKLKTVMGPSTDKLYPGGARMIVFPAMPVRNACVSITFHREIFSPEECQGIIDSIDQKAWKEGLVGGHGRPGEFLEKPEARSCREQQLPIQSNGYPINRICAELCQANSDGWKFELSGIVGDDMPFVMRYDADGRGHNDWHVDLGQAVNASRKLAFTVQLSEADSYEGGDLTFHNMNLDNNVVRKIGTMTVFPTYWLHRVAPVTQGVRYAAVGWMHGPSFR